MLDAALSALGVLLIVIGVVGIAAMAVMAFARALEPTPDESIGHDQYDEERHARIQRQQSQMRARGFGQRL